MNEKLKKFIFSEQERNNYSLYKNDYKISFEFNIPDKYKPKNREEFFLPYFQIPLNSDKIRINPIDEDFFHKNIFIEKSGKVYTPFFIHPTSVDIFKDWINKKYSFIDETKSIFKATPTSSYRSLLVQNIVTNQYFITKVSIFGNVANGARQIDWLSADGQFFFSTCTEKAVKNKKDFKILRDSAAIGMTGDYPIRLSSKYNITYGPNKIQSFGNIIRRVDEIFDDNTETAIYSIASITSVNDKNDCYFQKIYNASGKTFENFFINDFMLIIFDKFFRLLSTSGISLESHCQNTFIEVTRDWKFTGNIVYRDFDITSLDRARFPFVFPKEWSEYISNRLDRTSLYSNLSAREMIGQNFFEQLLGSLEQACLLCAVELELIPLEISNKIHKKLCELFKNKLAKLFPIYDKEIFSKTDWLFWKDIYKNIDISEIPTELNIIKKFDKRSYERILINNTEHQISEYYETKNKFILGFSNNIFTELYIERD